MTMSWVGMVTGLPSAGRRMLLVDSIRIRDSACASADSGRGTAIWSPSKSALDAEPVQGRSTVQQHRVLGDDLLEDIPDHRTGPLHHPLGRLDVLRVVEVN